MREPDVTLTDFLLAAEALTFAILIWRSPSSTVQRWFTVFFAGTAAASLFGALVHGFFSDNRLLWRLTLVAIGVVAVSAWTIGARLLFSESIASIAMIAALVECAVYVLVVFLVTDAFAAAVANYLPATLFLIVAFYVAYQSHSATPLAVGLAGLLLTLVAAGVQQMRVAIHPVYFNHNAFYHALQAIALLLIFRGAQFVAQL